MPLRTLIFGVVLAGALVLPASVSAAGTPCGSLAKAGWKASDIRATHLTCASARRKLRRWLPPPLPANPIGWNCFAFRGRRMCAVGQGDAPRFTFKLKRRASAARACSGSVAEGGSAVTLRAVNIVVGRRVSCRGAKRLIRRYLNDALAFGDCYALGAGGVSHCRVAGWAFSTRSGEDGLRVRAKREGRTFRFDRRDRSHGG